MARESYLQALEYNPYLLHTYLSLVQLSLDEGNFETALEHSQKAVEIDPNNFQVRYARAIALAASGQILGAKKEVEMSLRLNPNFQPAKELYGQL